MKFTKLMKCELPKVDSKLQKTHFRWVLDEGKYLSLEEVHQLRETCMKEKEASLKLSRSVEVRDWFLVELGLQAGLRVGEMANLKCMDLLVKENQSSVVVQKGKGGRRRAVRINSSFKEICQWFLKWKLKIYFILLYLLD